MATPLWPALYPKVQNIGVTANMTFRVTGIDPETDVIKGYFVIVPSGAGAPSNVQIKNGQDSSGSPVAAGFSGNCSVYDDPSDYNAVASNLVPRTDYDGYFVMFNESDSSYSTVEKVDFFIGVYVDLAAEPDSHAGTELDPLSWTEAVYQHNNNIAGIFLIKGEIDLLTEMWPDNAHPNAQFLSWNLPLYGPYRFHWGISSVLSHHLRGVWEDVIYVDDTYNILLRINTVSLANTYILSGGITIVANGAIKGSRLISRDVDSVGFGLESARRGYTLDAQDSIFISKTGIWTNEVPW